MRQGAGAEIMVKRRRFELALDKLRGAGDEGLYVRQVKCAARSATERQFS